MSATSLMTPLSVFVSSLASFLQCGNSCIRSSMRCLCLHPKGEGIGQADTTLLVCCVISMPPGAVSITYLCVMPRDDSNKTFSLLCHAGVVSAAFCTGAGAGASSSATSASS